MGRERGSPFRPNRPHAPTTSILSSCLWEPSSATLESYGRAQTNCTASFPCDVDDKDDARRLAKQHEVTFAAALRVPLELGFV